MQNFEIIVVDDKEMLAAIGKIKHRTSLTFIRENYQQLSFSEEELRRKRTGILGTMFPPSWRTPDLKPEESEDAERNKYLQKQIQTSSALLLLLYDPHRRAPASEGDFLGIISLGCVMENMWLMANSLGISCHVLSSLSDDAVAREIKVLLGIPEGLMIACSLRLGYPLSHSTPLRVRREVADFTHYNRFGERIISL